MSVSADRSSTSSVFAAYPVRIQATLAVTLALLLAVINLPVTSSTQRVGWSPNAETRPPDHIELSEVRSESSSDAPSNEQTRQSPPPTGASTPPSTDAAAAVSEEPASRSLRPTPESDTTESAATTSSSELAVTSAAALTANDQHPRIVGGMGALYLNIPYPKQARDKGIQGRLKLEFTIRPDGHATNVEIVDSLHPLCDSAAVKGVQSVRFVPAENEGTPVPVRVRLPVRFRLLTGPSPATTAGLEQ